MQGTCCSEKRLREAPQMAAELGRKESLWPLWSELGLKGRSAE